jgi:hypothetical protein
MTKHEIESYETGKKVENNVWFTKLTILNQIK